jgi:hypothetical protein
MKKWLIGLLVLIILLLASIYIFIPKKLSVAQTNIVIANQNSIVRYFSSLNNWAKWPGGNSKDFLIDTPNSFFYNGMQFSATNKIDNGLTILIHDEDVNINSILTFYSLGKDSTALEWKCELLNGNNIFNRMANYKKALYIKDNMTFLLNKLHGFVEKEANVYNINIEHEIITDTLVMAQKADYKHYPTTDEVYGMIDQLRSYALANNINITNPPMMNVTEVNGVYQTMVAIPTNKPLANNGKIELKHLTPGTPMLSAIVTGGNYTTTKAMAILESYKLDHQSSSPAIPYYVLLTDRNKETDTTKWKTKVCNLLFPWFK